MTSGGVVGGNDSDGLFVTADDRVVRVIADDDFACASAQGFDQKRRAEASGCRTCVVLAEEEPSLLLIGAVVVKPLV
jgi:hypothetical protein